MTIGEKIKMLRTQKLMTQSELAGNEITRNMLSRIENGAAQPSLDTLRYLAERLNVSPGFLIANPKDEKMYVKYNEINDIKTAYLSENYRICRDMCINLQSTDDELKLILAECNVAIAKDEFNKGNLHAACEYFDYALSACAETVYNTNHISSVCSMYFKYMQRLSVSFSSNIIDENDVPAYAAMYDSFCVYINKLLLIDGDSKVSCGEEDIYDLHITAINHITEKEYPQALECLNKILFGETEIPRPMLYFVFCDLELCCKETEDFRGAYEYSVDKTELLQRLLS